MARPGDIAARNQGPLETWPLDQRADFWLALADEAIENEVFTTAIDLYWLYVQHLPAYIAVTKRESPDLMFQFEGDSGILGLCRELPFFVRRRDLQRVLRVVESNSVLAPNRPSVEQAILDAGKMRQLYDLVKANPGILQSEICGRLPVVDPQTLAWARRRPLLRSEPSGRSFKLYCDVDLDAAERVRFEEMGLVRKT